MSRYSCVFRNCNTIDTTGAPKKGEFPPSCKAKGCAGVFREKPSCRTFMHDALEPEPLVVIEFSEIRALRERRRHEFVLRPSEPISARSVLKVAKG